MLKHIVMFKLKDYSEELLNETKEVLLSMQGKVPTLRGIEVGADILKSARSYDIVLMVLVDDISALDAYQQDPYHISIVKKHIHSVTSSSVAIDYIV